MARKKTVEGSEAGASKQRRIKENQEPDLEDAAHSYDSNYQYRASLDDNQEMETHQEEPLEEEDQQVSEGRIPMAPTGLERENAELAFRIKMLEFMDNMKQELKQVKEERARQDRLIDHLLAQNLRPSSSTKKLAKVNIPSTFFGLCKAKKVKEFLLEMDNYYDVQKVG